MNARVLVVGASGAVGEAIAFEALERGCGVVAATRNVNSSAARRLRKAGVNVAAADLSVRTSFTALLGSVDIAILVPPLTLSAAVAGEAAHVRAVFFSSNNVAIDLRSPIYRNLARAEDIVSASNSANVILRPGLIYGDVRLPTIARLMQLARRSPVLPMPGSGRARMQPVYHADLARIAVDAALDKSVTGVFGVGGPDIVAMRELYRAIGEAAGRRVIAAPVPKAFLRAARAIGGELFPLDMAQISRADLDRVVRNPLPTRFAAKVSLRDGLRRLAEQFGYIKPA
ncbi:MAG: NmrA family NAD(P)-binding protein [Caulobacterales bacterium]